LRRSPRAVSRKVREVVPGTEAPVQLHSGNAIRSLGAREIKLVMLAAAGIKRGVTKRALIAACHIFVDGHFISASTAEHCGLGPFHLRPDLNRMVCQSQVALLAGVINAAAFHPDGNNIESSRIVSTAGLRIEIDSVNFRAQRLHRSTDYRSLNESS
jgi:hypothetical protein